MPKNGFREGLSEFGDKGNYAWESFKSEVKPLDKKSTITEIPTSDSESFQVMFENETEIAGNSVNTKTSIKTEVVLNRRSFSSKPSIPTCDIKAKKKLKKGHVEIEDTCDLHGCTEDQARHRLFSFVRRAQHDDKRLVLVITGKGKNSPTTASLGKIGLLKQRVPGWLNSEKFSPYVISHMPANKNQGGDGALYVRIRKKNKLFR